MTTSALAPRFAYLKKQVAAQLTPYHLVLAGAIGLATVGLLVIVGVLLLIATNFNLLGAIE